LPKDTNPNVDLRNNAPVAMSISTCMSCVTLSTWPLLSHLPRLHRKTLRFYLLFVLPKPFPISSIRLLMYHLAQLILTERVRAVALKVGRSHSAGRAQ
jgi:hypothetical protein